MPSVELLPLVAIDSIAITIVSYTITVSMALIFAQKLSYEIDSNQEFLAMVRHQRYLRSRSSCLQSFNSEFLSFQGFSNVVGSFFSCMPISASLSRSLIQQAVGGRTQITSVVSCLLLLVILLWIGPFFELLPRCVLASIIVVCIELTVKPSTIIRKHKSWKTMVFFFCRWH